MSSSSPAAHQLSLTTHMNADNAKYEAGIGGAPRIPPQMWGHVLGYALYGQLKDVLSLFDGSHQEAVARSVPTLNFTEGGQLDGPTVAKFLNVEEVNCLSFLRDADADEDGTGTGGKGMLVVCRETACRLVSVLTLFKKLRRIFVGGGFAEERDGVERLVFQNYFFGTWRGRNRAQLGDPANLPQATSVACQLLGALKARVIPPLEKMGGAANLFEHTLCRRGRHGTDLMQLCNNCCDVCAHLPMEDVISGNWISNCCDSTYDTLLVAEEVGKRDGGKDLVHLTTWYDDHMRDVFTEGLQYLYVSSENKILWQKLLRLGTECDFSGCVTVLYLERWCLDYIDRMLAVGWQPTASHKDQRWSHFLLSLLHNQGVTKSTFDAFVSRGFPFRKSDCIILDDKVEPALREIPALSSS